MSGLSNIDIEKYFMNEHDNLKANFKKVVLSDSLTKYIHFKKILGDGKSCYPFIIMNTARKNQKGVHWWSILNLDPKKHLFLFDSEGFEGFKFFILQDDKDIIDKLLYNVQSFGKKDKKIDCVTLTFSVANYYKLKESELKRLSQTAYDLFHLLSEYAAFKGHSDDIKVSFVNDQLQKFDTSSCGNYQLYFYKHLFDPLKTSKVVNEKKLTKNVVQTLLNEIFTHDLDENEERVAEFSDIFNLKHN